MAKAGMWMQGARGRTGEIVYAKGKGGKTVQRRYVAPSNPRTNAQMAQRIIFSTVTQAASFMDPIVNHSFEGLSKAASRVAFVKENLSILRNKAASDYNNNVAPADATCFTTTKNISQLIPNAYLISKGSLNYRGVLSWTPNASGTLLLKLGNFTLNTTPQTSGYTLSVKEFLNALGMFSENDQLTFAGIYTDQETGLYRYNNTDSKGYVILSSHFQAVRLIPAAGAFDMTVEVPEGNSALLTLKNALSTIFSDKSSAIVLDALGAALQASSSSISGNVLSVTGGTGALKSQYDDEFPLVAAAIIMSRLASNGKWLRSRAQMELSPFTSIQSSLAWPNAIPAWFEERQLTDNTRYLNEGGENNTI